MTDVTEFERRLKINAEKWLDSLRKATRCAWCGCDDALNRRALCASCERTRKKLEKALKEKMPDAHKNIRIKRAEVEKQNCLTYGVLLKSLLDGTASGLNVEHLLTDLSQRMTSENLFHGYSTSIDWCFNATQRTIIAHLIWKILSRQAQRNRRYFAAQDLLYAAQVRHRTQASD